MRTPVLPVPADVAEAADCERLIATTVDKLGAVDILVNNAALFAVVPMIDADAAEAARFFAVNAIGPLNAARAFARWAIGQGKSGAIVNVSSIAAGRPAPGLGLYSATKAALDSLTRTMAVEVGWTWAAGQCGCAGPCRDRGGASGLKDRPPGREGGAGAHSRRPHRRWRRHC